MAGLVVGIELDLGPGAEVLGGHRSLVLLACRESGIGNVVKGRASATVSKAYLELYIHGS